MENKYKLYEVGDVMRPISHHAFGDSVITRINEDGTYRLSRPYLYASTSGSPLMGYETIDRVVYATLDKYWDRIDTGRIS